MINCVRFVGLITVSAGKTACLCRVQNLLNRNMYCTVLLSRECAMNCFGKTGQYNNDPNLLPPRYIGAIFCFYE